MTNKIIFLIAIISICVAPANAAHRYVDYPPAEIGSGWDGVDGTAYSGTPGTGFGYSTMEQAFANMVPGDFIWLRAGTYSENFGDAYTAMQTPYAANGTSWNPGEFSKIESYPGEWAVIDGSGSGKICAFGDCDSGNGAETDIRRYWVVQRVEITGGLLGGLGIWEGPVKVRYCYIHTNVNVDQNENPSGIRSYRLKNSQIKYCLFDDNGTTATPTHNCAHIAVFTGHYLDALTDPTRSGFNFANATHSNEIAYNSFLNTNGRAGCALKQKARQYLSSTFTDFTYQTYGDKVHHNIFEGDYLEPVMLRMDFQQIYNNIGTSDGVTTTRIWNANSTGSDPTGDTRPIYQVWYNNTIKDSCLSFNEGYAGAAKPIVQTNTVLNNIIDNFTSDFEGRGFRAMSFFRSVTGLSPSEITYTSAVDNNFFTNISLTDEFNWGNVNVSERDITVSEFNATHSTANYAADNTGLYVGASGPDRLITNGGYIVGGATTIADGGSGGGHPYLADVTLPSYIGATNPANIATNNWPEGLTNFDVAYFTSVSADSDPVWIDDVSSAPAIDVGADEVTTNATYNITGTATATAGRTISNVTLPGYTVIPDDGTWDEQVESFSVLVNLSLGANVFNFTAIDSEAEEGYDSKTITRNAVIVSGSIAKGCVIKGATIK